MGHPDKLADQISDSVLDAIIALADHIGQAIKQQAALTALD